MTGVVPITKWYFLMVLLADRAIKWKVSLLIHCINLGTLNTVGAIAKIGYGS